MPRIKAIASRRHSIPLKSALKWGRAHELKQLDHVLIRVELSDGAAGIAEAPPRPMIYGETPVSIIDIIDQQLAPLLIGQAADSLKAVRKLSARMELIKNNNTAKGALDMALHQAVAKHQGIPLREYLGSSRQRIQPSYIVSTGTPAEVTADVETAYHAGLRVFKVKIGKDIQQETDTIRQLAEQFPAARVLCRRQSNPGRPKPTGGIQTAAGPGCALLRRGFADSSHHRPAAASPAKPNAADCR